MKGKEKRPRIKEKQEEEKGGKRYSVKGKERRPRMKEKQEKGGNKERN